MKKSLIALAVVSAFTAHAAMADTTIYGAANMSYDMIDNGAKVNSARANNVSSNVSKIGFKGSEDLGNGLSAVWQIEQGIKMDTGALDTATGRNTFAGLSSADMGTVLLGFHDTPYKIATRSMDLFADTVADNRSIMGFAGTHDARLGNVVAYISPAFSGLTLAGAYVAGAEVPMAGATKATVYSLAALYGAGPLNVNAAYQTIKVGTAGSGTFGGFLGAAPSDKATALKVGVSYAMDAFQVNGVIERTGSTGTINNVLSQTNLYAGGKFKISDSDAVKVAVTLAGKINSANDTQSNQFSVGYDHNLSKRTTVYVLGSRINNKANSNDKFSQSTSAANANGGPGSSPTVISLGMKHSF